MLRDILTVVQWGFLGYFIALNVIYLGFSFIAIWRLRGYMGGRSAAERVYSHLQMPISLVVPAYNEARTIATSVRALLQLRYQHFEVIIGREAVSPGKPHPAPLLAAIEALKGECGRAAMRRPGNGAPSDLGPRTSDLGPRTSECPASST